MTSSKSSTPLSGKMEEMGLGDAGDVFVSSLDSTLRKSRFTDTTKHIFTSADNTLYLDATIKNITINEFKRTSRTARSTSPNEALSLELEIEWRVLDYYRQPVCITTTKQTSDIYTVMYRQSSYNEGEEPAARLIGTKAPMQRAIANNMTRSLAALQTELTKIGLLKKGGHGNDTTAVISLVRPSSPGAGARLNQMLKSSVSIKTDDGHGSGVIVSEDGYIITNYHVVAGAKSIGVIFNDDSKVTARVVRTSTGGDLALLKVEKDSLKPLPLSENKSPDLGVDAWAIGTPRSLELGQTISKGIISGIRTTDDLSYIQTDVKISPGNSGGALINRNGEVLGIISAKLIGFGTEGIGFAITSYQVLEKLKIAYK
jgi:S1-C subfamily serine protease